LDYNISARVISAYNDYDILTDTTLSSQKDLTMIYSSVKYEYQKPMDAYAKDSAESKEPDKKDLFGMDENKDADTVKIKKYFRAKTRWWKKRGRKRI